MGAKQNQLSFDNFLLQHLSKMSLHNKKVVSYYFISSQRPSQLQHLRELFRINVLQSVGVLRQEIFIGRQEVVKVIITDEMSHSDIDDLQASVSIAQLVCFNCEGKEGKRKGNVKTFSELIDLLNSLEEIDQLQIPANNYFCYEKDTNIINLYQLNYRCIIGSFINRSKAKDDFVKLARKLYPEQVGEIDMFQRQYNIDLKGEQKRKMVLDWVFRNNFYWDIISQITKNTSDPKRTAYLRLPIQDIFETIR